MSHRPTGDPNHSGQNFVGPLEVGVWPSTITARVVTPGAEPCIHGYDVETDLARQCRFGDLILLSLTGELPTEQCSATFEVALTFLLPLSVDHAPTHAAVLARLSGAHTSSTLGVAAVALGEQARFILDEHAELLQALKRGDASIPPVSCTSDTDEIASVQRLDEILQGFGVQIPILKVGLTRTAALLVVLFHCGLAEREQLEAVMVLARLPSVLAESFAERVANFRQYPINLPRYCYEESP